MLGKRLARQACAGERRDHRGPDRCDLGGEFILICRGLELFELQLELIETATRALGVRAETIALKLAICSLRCAIWAWSADALARAEASSASARSARASAAISAALRAATSLEPGETAATIATIEITKCAA